MSSCVFPGSFDPVTLGHMDIIHRAACIFDRVTVALMVNVQKAGSIAPEKRLELLKTACGGLENVQVVFWEGLLAEYMLETGERCVIRGTRNASEFDAENASAAVNRLLNPDVETLLMPSSDKLAHVSSSMVREIAAFGGDIRQFVPVSVADEIQMLLSK